MAGQARYSYKPLQRRVYKLQQEKVWFAFAIWITCEVWDFGTLSTLFGGMKEVDQDRIALKYGVSNGRVFATWLRSLNYLRNVCAHHSRLWNRNIVDQPKLPNSNELMWTKGFEGDAHAKARPFLLYCIAKHILDRINPTSSWWARLGKLIEEDFPHDIEALNLSIKGMGAIEGWEKLFP